VDILRQFKKEQAKARLKLANISTTMDLYGHYLKSADKEAADRLEQVYQNITRKQNEQAN